MSLNRSRAEWLDAPRRLFLYLTFRQAIGGIVNVACQPKYPLKLVALRFYLFEKNTIITSNIFIGGIYSLSRLLCLLGSSNHPISTRALNAITTDLQEGDAAALVHRFESILNFTEARIIEV